MDRETRRRLCRVLLVFLGLAALAGLVVLLKPPCPFSALTGLSCAGCGGPFWCPAPENTAAFWLHTLPYSADVWYILIVRIHD